MIHAAFTSAHYGLHSSAAATASSATAKASLAQSQDDGEIQGSYFSFVDEIEVGRYFNNKTCSRLTTPFTDTKNL